MRNGRSGAQIIGLILVIALGVAVVPAATASASGEFRINGKVLAAGEEAELEGTSEAGKFLVPGLGLSIECKDALVKLTAVRNITIGPFKHTHGKIHILLLDCFVEGNKFCKIYPTEADRTAGTNAGHMLATFLFLERLIPILSHKFTLKPLNEEKEGIVSKIFFTVGKGCTLTSAEISGSTAFILVNANTEETSHKLEPITEKEEAEAEVQLRFGKEPARLDGGAITAHLIGKFLNQKWSLN